MTTGFSTDCPQPSEGSAVEALLGEALEVAGWRAVVETLSERGMSAHAFKTYVSAAQVVGASTGILRLGYGSAFLADWVRDNYRDMFERELLATCNRPVRIELTVVDAVVEPAVPVPSRPPTLELLEGGASPKPAVARTVVEPLGPGEPPVRRRGATGLESRYTFDTFVVGGSNQFAFAACQAVAEGPGRTYNPLFLWGGVGLGKTHLMHAVGNKVAAGRPGAVVLYTSCEQFTNEMVAAIAAGRMAEFRKRYRECDVLLIDDVQFLARKPATQEEFFHTFNSLHAQGKQIIVSSDTQPNELNGMEERLRSRFQWGLIADIQAPELETRLAILQSKAGQMRLALPADVGQFLAAHIRQNVRELEGSLTRLAAFSNLMKGPLTVELCKEVLRSLLVNRGERIDCDTIIRRCAEHFRVTVAEIRGHARTRHLARARQAAMYLARSITRESFPELGRKFGGKDHSTVINACDRVKQLIAEDEPFRRSVEQLERELTTV